MNKLLAILALIFSTTLLIAGCTSQTTVDVGSNMPSDAASNEDDLDAAENDAEDNDDVMAGDESNEGTKIDVGTEIVAENKTAAEVHDETLAAVADGTYVENVNYMSPGGLDTIEISITVENDIVTDASITTVVADKTSKNYQTKVNAALPDLVVGKKITEIDIPDQISGSSLTTAAFKKQLADVIAENPA